MNINQVGMLKKTFDDYKQIDEYGNEFWYAHDLSKLLGYSEYSHFKPAIERAKLYLLNTGKNPNEHLAESRESFVSGNGAVRQVDGYKLTKLSAYAIAMNSDPSKIEVAFAQEYFLQCTATVEVLADRMYSRECIEGRNMVREANKSLAETLPAHNVFDSNAGIVFSEMDRGFFGMPTSEIKDKYGLPNNKPVADILGPKMSAFKAVGIYCTEEEIIKQNAMGVEQCSKIAYDENNNVRNLVQDKFRRAPETFIGNEDSVKVERKYNRQTKNLEKKLFD